MRIGEICALDKRDINRIEKYIRINKTAYRHEDKFTGEVAIKTGPPKTKYSIRRIPLLPSVEVILDRQEKLVEEMQQQASLLGVWNENTLVFPTNEGNIHDKSGMRSAMQRILKRAGLPYITIHALRHTYATTALNSGVAAQNVAKVLGHKDSATTLKLYAHYIGAEALAQLDKLEEKNISHLGITDNELQKIEGTDQSCVKPELSERLSAIIQNAKYMPYEKSIMLVLDECEKILCEPLDNLTPSDKDVLLRTLAQYTYLKRAYLAQEDIEPQNHPSSSSLM